MKTLFSAIMILGVTISVCVARPMHSLGSYIPSGLTCIGEYFFDWDDAPEGVQVDKWSLELTYAVSVSYSLYVEVEPELWQWVPQELIVGEIELGYGTGDRTDGRTPADSDLTLEALLVQAEQQQKAAELVPASAQIDSVVIEGLVQYKVKGLGAKKSGPQNNYFGYGAL